MTFNLHSLLLSVFFCVYVCVCVSVSLARSLSFSLSILSLPPSLSSPPSLSVSLTNLQQSSPVMILIKC